MGGHDGTRCPSDSSLTVSRGIRTNGAKNGRRRCLRSAATGGYLAAEGQDHERAVTRCGDEARANSWVWVAPVGSAALLITYLSRDVRKDSRRGRMGREHSVTLGGNYILGRRVRVECGGMRLYGASAAI